jgi:hypothetical protein
LGEAVHVALSTAKPKERYAVIPQRFKNWTVPRLLPARMLDAELGVLTAIAVAGSPRHHLRHGRAFPGEQKPVLIFEALQSAPRYVVLASRSQSFRHAGVPPSGE